MGWKPALGEAAPGVGACGQAFLAKVTFRGNLAGDSLVQAGMMKCRTLLRLLSVALGVAATGGAALAQSDSCQRLRGQLASLGRGDGGSGAAAQRQRAEIARMTGYYQSIGCSSGASFFFSPPAECGAIAARIRSMEASYYQLAASPHSDGTALRRRQLAAAVKQACQRGDRAKLERARATSDDDGEERARKATGGKRLVCVRACDGFFFPLDNTPDGRGGADEMCKALCPGAEAAAYSMPGGDGDIDQALSMKGKPYTQLANAFKFRKSADPSCSCRKPGQSWTEALQKAEKMLDRHPDDIIVTAKKAEELSRPRIAKATSGSAKKRGKAPAETETPPEAYASHREKPGAETSKPSPAAASPTATAQTAKVSEADAAAKSEPASEAVKESAPSDPPKRKVRIVAPLLYKAPEIRTP